MEKFDFIEIHWYFHGVNTTRSSEKKMFLKLYFNIDSDIIGKRNFCYTACNTYLQGESYNNCIRKLLFKIKCVN